MRSTWDRSECGVKAMFFVLFCVARADAGLQLISNGDFESGLSGWTVAIQPGGQGGWYDQSGTRSPLTRFPVEAPPGPTHSAMSDASFGSQVLYQDFVVPQGGVVAATLTFERFIANQYDLGSGAGYGPNPFSSPDSLDYTISGNRQARVDILGSGADPFSVSAGDVLLNLFRTRPDDPSVSDYETQSADLTALLNAHAGQTLRLRFAEVNNQGFFRYQPDPLNFGVDLVGLDATLVVPEPSSLALLAFGSLGLASHAWRKRFVGRPEDATEPDGSPEIDP